MMNHFNGTVIYGTLRNQDLLPEFVATALEINPDKTLYRLSEFLPNMRALIYEHDHPWWQSDDAVHALDAVIDLLNEYAPEGIYFGAHPDDGADFGFWRVNDDDNS